MLISGFTMVRNAEKYYFPIKASIESILPIVDEFVVAVGKGEDKTREIIESINSPKVKIIDREWDEKLFFDGEIFRAETNFAMDNCKGEWCFYLQADEVVHEQYLNKIEEMCKKYKEDKEVEGFLFQYKHFWGDYEHYLDCHGWYPKEIRIVRNNIGVRSYKDAQSFRIEDRKLNVIDIPAYIYHYGWVRPPVVMTPKKKEQDSMHNGKGKEETKKEDLFNYGPLGQLPVYKDTNPKVMNDWIKDFHWKEQLNYGKEYNLNRKPMKHERLKYKVITIFEKIFNSGNQIGGFKNYKIIGREK